MDDLDRSYSTPRDGVASMLDRTVSVLQEAERLLVKRSQIRWKQAEVVVDSIWHGPSFVMMGLGEQMRLVKLGLVLLLVWWAAMVGIGFFTGSGTAGWSQGFWPAAVMATACLIFRIPSSGTLHGINRSSVQSLAMKVRELCPTEEMLGALKENLGSLSDVSAKHRVRLQALLGVFWAALVWIVATWVLPPSVSQAARNGAASWAFLGAFFFVFAGMATVGYATASRIFWQTIELALSEVSSGSLQATTPPSP